MQKDHRIYTTQKLLFTTVVFLIVAAGLLQIFDRISEVDIITQYIFWFLLLIVLLELYRLALRPRQRIRLRRTMYHSAASRSGSTILPATIKHYFKQTSIPVYLRPILVINYFLLITAIICCVLVAAIELLQAHYVRCLSFMLLVVSFSAILNIIVTALGHHPVPTTTIKTYWLALRRRLR